MKALVLFALMFPLIYPTHAEEAYQATAKVWDAMGRKNWDGAIAQANRVIRIWGAQARRTNDQLKKYAPAKDAKNTAASMKWEFRFSYRVML